ncbi:uncharacterized protein LOC128960528 [Oppia nitens]|uniref:uncharacterized protein LOC128960528 n=1 Tax=Oppia nitens TaxID=1686743 RepID=UPI0023DABB8C|nr:uncharacterized protein LOC128960528 [Oppia nitens]
MTNTMISEDVLNDILFHLNDMNNNYLNQINNNFLSIRKFCCTSGVVQNLMSICETFQVDNDVKYIAIEMMDKLIVNLVIDTKKVFFETTHALADHPNAQQLDWNSIEDKLKKQMHLRAVTCVAIAVKGYNGSKQMITTTKLRQFLHKCGYNYSLQNINRSELRVLRLLDFKLIHNSLYTYVQTLLDVLNHNIVNFSQHLNAYKIIGKRLTLDMSQNNEELEIEKIFANKMLIASAIIASVPIVTDVSLYEQVVIELADICRIDANLILDTSQAILVVISEV